MSVALTRQMLWKMLGADHPMEAHRIDSKAVYWMGRSPDAHEGVSAFLEKRAAEVHAQAERHARVLSLVAGKEISRVTCDDRARAEAERVGAVDGEESGPSRPVPAPPA